MLIENNILKYYLRNVYFINGTAYAGKSTAVHMLAERFGLVECGENYHMAVTEKIADEKIQLNLTYFRRMKDWKEFVTRSPEEYEKWILGNQEEVAGFEIAEVISLARDRKVIVDTNIPLHVLKEITDYNHVAIMVCPQSMSADRFFDRSDPDKQFLLNVIDGCENRDEVMENFRQMLMRVNSKEHYDEFVKSGFFTLVREDDGRDTREEVVTKLAKHFGFI